jgi:hypothetical protein
LNLRRRRRRPTLPLVPERLCDRPAGEPNARIRGGCTLIVDLPSAIPRYLIRKRLEGPDGVAKQFGFHLQMKKDGDVGSLQSNYYDTSALLHEPFALLHGRH